MPCQRLITRAAMSLLRRGRAVSAAARCAAVPREQRAHGSRPRLCACAAFVFEIFVATATFITSLRRYAAMMFTLMLR